MSVRLKSVSSLSLKMFDLRHTQSMIYPTVVGSLGDGPTDLPVIFTPCVIPSP